MRTSAAPAPRDDPRERLVAQARHVVDDAGARVEARGRDLGARRVDRDAGAALGRVPHDLEHARELLARPAPARRPGRVDSPPTSMMSAPSREELVDPRARVASASR